VKRKWLTTNGMQYNWGTICASIELEMSEYCLQAAHCLGIILWLENMSDNVEQYDWIWCVKTMWKHNAMTCHKLWIKIKGDSATQMDY